MIKISIEPPWSDYNFKEILAFNFFKAGILMYVFMISLKRYANMKPCLRVLRRAHELISRSFRRLTLILFGLIIEKTKSLSSLLGSYEPANVICVIRKVYSRGNPWKGRWKVGYSKSYRCKFWIIPCGNFSKICPNWDS